MKDTHIIIFIVGEKDLKFLKTEENFWTYLFINWGLLLGHNSKIFKKSLKEITKKNISPLASPNSQANNFAKLLKKNYFKQK